MNKRISSPQPSVIHLVTLFRQISSGEIRIPAFQRDYVWTEKQILSLLDSVLESFPIGSLLFWRVESELLKVAPREQTAFPDKQKIYPLNYVLDGMQRLTTLYGVFNYDETSMQPKLHVGFNLRERKFVHIRDTNDTAVLPLNSLFSPKKLLEYQSLFIQEQDGESLMDTVLELQSAFQEYMVPTVTIQSTEVGRVVGIFERVNSTGTRLNSVDFMRAITWSNTFDLSRKIGEVSASLSEINWNVSDDTLVKMVAVVLGMDVSSESLLALRDVNEARLHNAFEQIPEMIWNTAEFLHDEFGITSPDVVSYEGQLLSAFLVSNSGRLHDLRPQFEKWFWSCGLNEQLRGKSDDYIVKLLSDWSYSVKSGHFPAVINANFTDRDFLKRRVMAGAALTNTFKMMHARNGARDLVTGDPIPESEYLANTSTAQFHSILSKREISETLDGEFFSAKLYSNCLLQSFASLEKKEDLAELVRKRLNAGDVQVLESQFIPESAAQALVEGNHLKFLMDRANAIYTFGLGLVGQQSQ